MSYLLVSLMINHIIFKSYAHTVMYFNLNSYPSAVSCPKGVHYKCIAVKAVFDEHSVCL